MAPREPIVPRYLPTMLNAGEIGDALFVSVYAVKAYLLRTTSYAI